MNTITAFLAKYNITKHSLVAVYTALFTLFQTNSAFQSYVLGIYAAFPHWLSALVVGLIVPLITFYHLGTSSSSTTSTVVKSTAAALIMLVLLSGVAGCTPASTNSAVKSIVAYLPTVQSLADEGVSLYQLFDPSQAAAAQAAETTINNAITSLTTIANTYLQQPTSTNWNSVVNLVNSLVSDTDAQLLAANKITNPTSQAQAIAVLGALDLAVHALDGYVQNAQPAATVSATAAARTTKLKNVSQYWPADRVTPQVAQQLQVGEALGF